MVQGPSTTDRLDGVNEGIAKKAPVRVRSIGNITLSGLQTIDGVALAADDRVLVMAQTDATTNGIYNASSGVWTRALDFDGNRDIVDGTMVFVNAGSTYLQTMWVVTTDNPIVIDEDDINFILWSGGGGFPNEPYVVVGNTSDVNLPNNRQAAAGTGITMTDGGAASTLTFAVSTNTRTATAIFIIDGGGSTISTGIAGDIQIHFACSIQSVTLLADQSGSCVVDFWADSYANFPPSNADSITAAATPTISAATKSTDATLTGWTTALAADTIIRFNVDSATAITRLTIAIELLKTS